MGDANADADDAKTAGQLASQNYLQSIVDLFPQDHLVYSFGYGSGVFSQNLAAASTSSSTQTATAIAAGGGMLDLILVVDDAQAFHRANLRQFPNHYASWLRYMDGGNGRLCARLQTQGFLPPPWFPDAHVLFHVVDSDEDENSSGGGSGNSGGGNTAASQQLPARMKYGVVQQNDLLRDLMQWETLYLAGRLQKPTLPALWPTPPDSIIEAQTVNLQAATAAALLLMSGKQENVSETNNHNNKQEMYWSSFFETIALLSYSGDFRMQVGGEDPHKLQKLVQATGQLQRFQSLYQPSLQRLSQQGLISVVDDPGAVDGNGNDASSSGGSIGRLEWNIQDDATKRHLQKDLPLSLQQQLDQRAGSDNRDFSIFLAQALAGIVAPVARNQSFKGIFTLGLRKSIRYASAKLSKGLLRKR